MKKALFSLVAVFGLTAFASAQYHTKMDGTPDMRYKENRQTYGGYNSSSYPSSTYSTPTYKAPTYTSPYGGTSSYPSYPTTRSGQPDMRYKENRSLYGTYGR